MDNDFILDEALLEKLNRFARARVTADEVYTFPIVLCDNEIDRDGERFSISALEKLAELFVGKTGIFDHNPKGENQTARIFDCEVKTDASKTASTGEAYTYLCAKAYMMRTPKTADLIAEIDGGIKKEVSVGCSVKSKICSICGADQNENPCGHIKGAYYGGKLCSVILDLPEDAYEWSFVAIPAQKNAGVTKKFEENRSESETVKSLEKRLAEEASRTSRACELLKREIMSLSFLCRPIAAVETVKTLTGKMSFEELEQLYFTLKKQCGDSQSELQLFTQNRTVQKSSQQDNQAFSTRTL